MPRAETVRQTSAPAVPALPYPLSATQLLSSLSQTAGLSAPHCLQLSAAPLSAEARAELCSMPEKADGPLPPAALLRSVPGPDPLPFPGQPLSVLSGGLPSGAPRGPGVASAGTDRCARFLRRWFLSSAAGSGSRQ